MGKGIWYFSLEIVQLILLCFKLKKSDSVGWLIRWSVSRMVAWGVGGGIGGCFKVSEVQVRLVLSSDIA